MSQKLHFILIRTEIVQSGVPPDAVVKAHDVAEDFGFSMLERCKDSISTFPFEGRPEALHRCIVEAVTDAAHTDGYAAISEHLLVA